MRNNNSITIRNVISKLFDRDKRKIYVYTLSSVITMFMAFIVSVLLTRWLDSDVYGQYKYAMNLLLTVPTYIEFGIHFCVSRIVAEDNDNESHGVVPVSLAVVYVFSLISTLVLFLIPEIGQLFINSNKISSISAVKIVFPFVFVFSGKTIITQLYQGTGKIYRLSVYSLAQYILIISAITVGHFFLPVLTFEYCILAFIIANAVIQIPVMLRIQIHKSDLKKNSTRLINDVRSFGFKIYISSFATTGASSLISLICGSVYGFSEYAYYTLALSLAQFFTFISSAMATVKFKTNVTSKTLNKKDVLFMIAMNAAMYLVFSLLIEKIFIIIYSAEYARAIFYLRILAVSYIFNGMTMYYNRFFVARKKGKIIMRNSIIAAGINIIISIVLIPQFEITGLVLSSLISAACNFIIYVITYITYEKNEKIKERLSNND